jgi:hypothetical protein
MIDYLKARWIAVGFCWMAAILMTFWNLNTIDSIEKGRQKKEIYLMDEQFWNHNVANISQILKKSASLIQQVESSKLGLFEFESNIRNLALKSDLNAIELNSESQFKQDGIIPVQISFQSTFQHAAKWLDQVELKLPYAQIRDVNIELDKAAGQNKFSVSLYYRYKQTATKSSL